MMRIQEFDYSVDLLQVIIWQYNEASRILSLINQKQDWYDENQTQFWEDWFNNVFNLITANGFGLIIWSIILELPLFLGPPPDPPDKPIWGFGEFNENFEHGNFTNANSANELTTAEKRLLLRLRFFKLQSRDAIPEVNEFLHLIFGTEGPTYILDGLHMNIVLVFLWPVNPRLVENIIRYDLIPRDTGVLLTYVPDPDFVFGFGSFNQNFDNGCFIQEF